MTKKHISYSELKTWAECPWKHNLMYLQGIKGFTGNLYTAFGTAIHSVCENIAKGLLTEDADREDFFDESFDQELEKLEKFLVLASYQKELLQNLVYDKY